MDRPKINRITQDHPSYKDFITEMRGGNFLYSSYFDKSLGLLDEYNHGSREEKESIQECIARSLGTDENILGNFISMSHSKHPDSIISKLKVIWDAYDYLEHGVNIVSIQKLIRTANQNDIQEILEINQNRFIECQELVTEQSHIFKKEFLKRLEELIVTEKIPISLEYAKKRIADVHIKAVDGLSAPASLTDVGGIYDPHSDTIYIPSWNELESLGRLKATFFHEFFHALSGKDMYSEDSDPAIEMDRIGLHVTPFIGDEKLRWLNEAVTESLTQKILGASTQHYAHEIALFEELCDIARMKGVDLRIFAYDAYFENANPATTPRVPAWHAFARMMTQTFSQGFLSRLDTHIQEYGTRKTLEDIKTGIIQ